MAYTTCMPLWGFEKVCTNYVSRTTALIEAIAFTMSFNHS